MNTDQDIAVIGIGCRLPASVETPEQFWTFLCQQGDASSGVPADRWSVKRFYAPDYDTPGKTYMQRGSFLDQKLADMEPLFFGISPREAVIIDTQQRVLLEVAWEALENAGILPGSLAGSQTGVYMGSFSLDRLVVSGSSDSRPLIRDHYAATAASATMLAARLSYNFDLHGPSMSIDTACSSSLVAVHQACVSLRHGETSLALAGGVNIMGAPSASITMSKGHFISKDGRCKSFSDDADGYGRGEGCGIVVLKRLSDAVRDGDIIHGVIAASGVNQDGHTFSLTMPDEEAQADLIERVAERADIDLAAVGYAEAHGTGTPVGDPIEARALGRAVGQARKATGRPLLVGSMKANFGHLEGAAGVAGLIKAVLCLKNAQVPPQANLTVLNKNIPFDELNLRVPVKDMVALDTAKDIYSVVNSFGYGGTNAVAVLRACPEKTKTVTAQHDETERPEGHYLLPVTAFTESSLKKIAASYATLLSDSSVDLADMCFSAATTRTPLEYYATVLAKTRDEAAAALNALAAGAESAAVVRGRKQAENPMGGPVFVFSGMGSQVEGMMALLSHDLPAPARAVAEKCDALFAKLLGFSLTEFLSLPENAAEVHKTQLAQPAIFLVQMTLFEALRFYGVTPAAVTGHSVGEVAAACAAGVLTLEDAVTIAYYRSQHQSTLAGTGTMLAVGLNQEEAEERFVSRFGQGVCTAVVNSSRLTVLSGPQETLSIIADICKKNKIFSKFLPVELPYHNPAMEKIEAGFKKDIAAIPFSRPVYPLYSTVTASRCDDAFCHDAAYWYDNTRLPVRFSDTVEALAEDGARVFIEIAAQPVLSSSLRDVARTVTGNATILSCVDTKKYDEPFIARTLAHLFMAGVSPDWARVSGGERIVLPHYAWTRESFWVETRLSRQDRLDETIYPVLGMQAPASLPTWLASVNTNYMPWLPDHQIDDLCLFPAAGYIEGAVALHAVREKTDEVILEDIAIDKALLLDDRLADVQMSWVFNPADHSLTVASRDINDDDSIWVPHATMKILSSAPWPVAAPEVTLPYAEGSVLHAVMPQKFYEEIKEYGFAYGPSFQTIISLDIGDKISRSALKLADEHAGAADEYFLHPTLWDGAFQTLIAAGYGTAKGTLFVPTGIRQVRLYHKGLSAVRVHCVLTKKTASDIQGNILIVTESGELVAEVKDFTARAIRTAARSNDDLRRKIYRNAWVKTEEKNILLEEKKVIICGAPSELAKRVAAELALYAVEAEQISEPAPGSIDPELYNSIIYVADKNEEDLGITELWKVKTFFDAVIEKTERERSCVVHVLTSGAVTPYPLEKGKTLAPDQAAVRGFVRGIQAEKSNLSIKLVDIGTTPDEDVMRALCAEILNGEDPEEMEDDVLLTPQARFAGRLQRSEEPPAPQLLPFSADERDENGALVAVRLETVKGAAFDALHYERFVCPKLKKDEVLFRILATALNFKDILKATGLLPDSIMDGTFHGHEMGSEATAEVVAVGEGVTGYETGKRYVISWPGGFATHLVALASEMISYPLDALDVDYLQASTLPIASATAYCSLVKLARLQKGETVLIHAGTGGVGMTAIYIAQHIGARIFATAGSEAKRAYLKELGCEQVWSSRTLEFAEGIRDVTQGRGVDVVLNSLPGDALSHSVAVVAPYGRFVEIGKKDIIENNGLPLMPFNQNMAFFSFDLDRMMLEQKEDVRELMKEMAQLHRQGVIKLPAVTGYPAAKVADAFRFLASSAHIGKVVVDYTKLEDVTAYPLPRRQPVVRSDVTYLVTGGAGGFGFATVKWLLDQGAKHFVLAGRRPETDEDVTEKLAFLRECDASVLYFSADCASEKDLDMVFAQAQKKLPPIKGVFHCAAVLDDALVVNMTQEKIAKVMTTKAKAAVLLDKKTQNMTLDYFVMYASATTMLGNIGQSNYMAANTVLNALSWNRFNRGLPSLTVDWGGIADVGMLSRNDVAARTLEMVGLRSITARQALDALPVMLSFDLPDLGYMDIDWEKWSKSARTSTRLLRFSQVILNSLGNAVTSERLARLVRLPDKERLPYVIEQMKALISETTHVKPEDIASTARLSELGIDSLAAVELQTSVKNELGVEISVLHLAKDNTIENMSKFILDRINVKNITSSESE
ncbi:type I polyketide synthase [Acetobacter thailandicus]|uniref:type I polyketide synthase n=1 Tax=Acetobacter thailandicus TaxID=1502842 RepID=UPI001BAC17FC|nr:SDR family NAD(P)-dependent oxidoreductase [Acetobacter thailandicus]